MNAGDQTDRLVVERQVEGFAVAPSGSICFAQDDDFIIETPPDIVSLRNTDRATALVCVSNSVIVSELLSPTLI